MSKITKRKYVEQEVMEFVVPTGNQQIVKVTGGRGNNLHAVVDAKGETFLVSMPNKFRKNIWIKRGDFIIIDPIEEGDKVRGEIAHVLFKDHVCHIQKEGLWPEAFGGELPKSTNYIEDDLLPPSDSEDEDDLAFRVVNVNKGSQLYEHSSDEEEEEEEEGGDEEEGEKGKRKEKRTMLLQPQKKLVEADRLFLLCSENVLLVRTESSHSFSALVGSSLFKTLLQF